MLKKLFGKKNADSEAQTATKKALMTDSGMLAVWDHATFSHIHDYDSWDAELCEDEDILKHIAAGKFVPINLGDGVFAVDVRIGEPAEMSVREKEYLLVPSQPYLLRTTGKVCVSGIERVAGKIDTNTIVLSVVPGEYAVYSNLIDWNQEPGATKTDGRPTENALPDIITYLSLESDTTYRTAIETFRKEDALR